MKKPVLVSVLLALLVALVPLVTSASVPYADPAIQSTWERTDKPIADGKTSRTWMWGPSSFFSGTESYAQSPGGSRTVQYFDKSRMEISNPSGDRSSQWFVTNGLLVKELITGQMQTGDSTFENKGAANIPVAGDPTNPWPTYASLIRIVDSRAPDSMGQYVTTTFLPEGAGSYAAGGSDPNAQLAYYENTLGHNVPRAFWDFLNSQGMVYENGQYVTDNLFDPIFYATGYPITEPYWAQVVVSGVSKPVLFQAFERRVLTYTPDNPEGWKVEMGNVGQHYHLWRYGAPQPQPGPGGYIGPAQNLVLQGSDIPAGYTMLDSKGLDLSSTPAASSGWGVTYTTINPLKTTVINNEVVVFPTVESAQASFNAIVQGVNISGRQTENLGSFGDQTVAFSGSRTVNGVTGKGYAVVFWTKNVISTIVTGGAPSQNLSGDATSMAQASESRIESSPTVQ